MRRTFVQTHNAVGSQLLLDANALFRRQFENTAIDMGPKNDLVVIHFALLRQAKHLKATAVGQDRTVPAHESMQPAKFFNNVRSRPQGQMIRVGQNLRRPGASYLVWCETLDRPERSHRHEGGSFNLTMRGLPPTRSRAGVWVGVFQNELKMAAGHD